MDRDRSTRLPVASRATAGTRPDTADLTVAYVGDGSRQWVPNLVQDLALSSFGGEVRLYDRDVESAERNAEFGNWVQECDAAADASRTRFPYVSRTRFPYASRTRSPYASRTRSPYASRTRPRVSLGREPSEHP